LPDFLHLRRKAPALARRWLLISAQRVKKRLERVRLS
jgi:hypothetical protein